VTCGSGRQRSFRPREKSTAPTIPRNSRSIRLNGWHAVSARGLALNSAAHFSPVQKFHRAAPRAVPCVRSAAAGPSYWEGALGIAGDQWAATPGNGTAFSALAPPHMIFRLANLASSYLAASSSPTARVLKVPPHPPAVELVAYDVGDQQHSDDRERKHDRAADDRPHEVPSLLYVHNRPELKYRPVVPAGGQCSVKSTPVHVNDLPFIELESSRGSLSRYKSNSRTSHRCLGSIPPRPSATISSILEGKMPTWVLPQRATDRDGSCRCDDLKARGSSASIPKMRIDQGIPSH
jgi:hypothetical protein